VRGVRNEDRRRYALERGARCMRGLSRSFGESTLSSEEVSLRKHGSESPICDAGGSPGRRAGAW
jgi:hypothetical protein